jgi:DNA-binding NtrC family response regulator
MKILLISSDQEIIQAVEEYTHITGSDLVSVPFTRDARKYVAAQEFDALLMDCSIRPMELIAFASDVSESLSETVVLLIGPLDQDQREKLGRRLSAHYSIDKPFRKKVFLEVMERVVMRSTIVRKAGLIGRSSAMEEIIQTIMQVGPAPITVLITGESGVGKEVIARAIHSVSLRNDRPFLAVNCAALAEGVLESELFGHEKGAFTGAASRRIGMFEKAHGGTIFLDEIGEIPHSTQIRLLRVLEEREIMRVGGTESIPVDVRIVAATNRDLRDLVEKAKFRRDLYYRIKVLELDVPPLRQRQEDIPLLIDRIAKRYSSENRQPVRRFDEDAKQYLSRAAWPGNVRELRNFVESCLALTNQSVIGLSTIPDHLLSEVYQQSSLPARREKTPEQVERELIYRTLIELKNDLTEIKGLLRDYQFRGVLGEPPKLMEVIPVQPGGDITLGEMERQAVIDALRQTQGNRRKAARLLGIGERTLYRKLKQHDIRET